MPMKKRLQLTCMVLFAFLPASCMTSQAGREGQTTHQPYKRSVRANSVPVIRQPGTTSNGQTSAPHAEGPLDLSRCIKLALDNNPAIARQEWDVEAARSERDIAGGALWPKVHVNGGYMHYRDDRMIPPRRPGTSEVLEFSDNLLTYNIVLDMPLYTGGHLRNEVKARELVARAMRKDLAYSRKELVFNVSSVFYSILSQEKVIDSLEYSRKALEEHCDDTRDKMQMQKAARVDLLRTEVRLADIEEQLLRERNILDIKRFTLARLLGWEGKDDSISIHGQLELDRKTDDIREVDSAFQSALTQREDYQALLLKIDAQQKAVASEKGVRMPRVSLNASYGDQWDEDDSDIHNEIGNVGVLVDIPLFEGGQISARINRERHRLNAVRKALDDLRLKIRVEVKTAIANIQSTEARIGVAQKAIEQAKESLRIEREKYRLGKGAIVDVLDAQAALLDSQMNYYKALAEHKTARAEYRLAIGQK
jgi:outer membrane protein TolC